MRQVGLAGIIILAFTLIITGVLYLSERGFSWAPSDIGFIHSFILTLGFAISLGAGFYGAIKEIPEFLIAAGTACITLALLNKLFANVLYSWGYLDMMLVIAGIIMIIDNFHVKRIRKARELEAASVEESKPEDLLNKLDKLKAEVETAQPDRVMKYDEIFGIKRQLWAEAKKRPELIKTYRIRLYRNPIVQEIVKRLINARLKIIEPVIETRDIPSYPSLRDLESSPQEKLPYVLNELVGAGILQEELYEKLVACPRCHKSSKVYIRNKCPKCNSFKVKINRLMQHIDCGAVYKHEEYHQPQGLVCPKCTRAVEEPELKSVGVSFECESCGSMFTDPNRAFHCRGCAEEFQLKNCELVSIFSYKLNDEVRSEAKETMTVLAIAKMIEKIGFTVNSPGILKGKTGVSHEFTLTCNKKDKTYAIDIAAGDDKVDTKGVLPSYAKFQDITNIINLLIAIPLLDQEAKEFLIANNIRFVEGEHIIEITERVKQLLES